MKRSFLVAGICSGLCAGLWMMAPFLAAAQDSSKSFRIRLSSESVIR